MSIKAMKLALEALEWINRVNAMEYEYQQKARESLNAIYDALAEQPAQQEPVAWFELLREARDNCKASIVEEGISASRKEYRIDLEARLTAALNTSPPAQRKPLVGLTDEDIGRCFDSADGTMGSLIAAIEAKLREKNS